MKKYLPYVIVALVVVIIIVLLTNRSDNLTPTNNINSNNEFIIIDKGDTIPEEICSEIKDDIIVVWKTGCPGCAITVPILQEIEEEQGLSFEYINVAEKEGRERLLRIGIVPRWVPTLIVDCDVYFGALKKEEYEKILEK